MAGIAIEFTASNCSSQYRYLPVAGQMCNKSARLLVLAFCDLGRGIHARKPGRCFRLVWQKLWYLVCICTVTHGMTMITDLLLGTLNTKRHHACTCTQYRTVPDQLAIAMQRRCIDCINPFGNWTAWKEVTILCCTYKLSASAQWLWVVGITVRQAGKHTIGAEAPWQSMDIHRKQLQCWSSVYSGLMLQWVQTLMVCWTHLLSVIMYIYVQGLLPMSVSLVNFFPHLLSIPEMNITAHDECIVDSEYVAAGHWELTPIWQPIGHLLSVWLAQSWCKGWNCGSYSGWGDDCSSSWCVWLGRVGDIRCWVPCSTQYLGCHDSVHCVMGSQDCCHLWVDTCCWLDAVLCCATDIHALCYRQCYTLLQTVPVQIDGKPCRSASTHQAFQSEA